MKDAKKIKNNPSNIKKKIIYLFAIGLSIFLFIFFIGSIWIGYEVNRVCFEAKRNYGKSDCVQALIYLVEDKNRSFRTRNEAVWALGQFADSKALPVLQKYYTGNIPERESYDQILTQYELQKAINLIRGEINLTAWIWRWKIK